MTLRNFLIDHVQLDSRLFIMEDTDEDVLKYIFNGKMNGKVFQKYTSGNLKDRCVLKFWFDSDGYVVVVISNYD